MGKVKEYITHIYDRLVKIYQPIICRTYNLLTDSETEWPKFVAENQSYIDVRKNYFIPMLMLLVVVQVFSLCIGDFFNELDAETSLLEVLFLNASKTIMISLVCYTLSGLLLYLLLGNSKFSWGLGSDFTLDKASVLIVFPYCISMLAQILNNLWSIFFIMSFIAVILSLLLVWKGLASLVPNITPRKHSGLTYLIGIFPVLINTICIKLFDFITH